MKKQIRVTLVSLGISRKEYPFLPGYFYCTSSGIHYVNAALHDHGYITTVVNQVTDNLVTEEIPEKIRETNPDIVLFNQFFTMRDRVRMIVRELGNNYIYGIGGHDATFHALSLVDKSDIPVSFNKNNQEPILLQPQSEALAKYYNGIDFIWLGEADKGISEFLETITKQKYPLLVYNLHNRVTDLDTLPLLKHDDYNSDVGFIVTSRGCMKTGCDFCTTPLFYTDGWLDRSIEHIGKEITNLYNSGKKYIYFCDDNFLGFNEKHLFKGIRIIEILKTLNIKCCILTSVHQVLKAEELGLLEKMSGTVTCIFLGIENPVASSIKNIGKKVNHDLNYKNSTLAVELIAKREIMPFLGYINFNPETTLQELSDSAGFLYKTNMEASIFHYLVTKLNIFEGTPIYYRYRNQPLATIDKKTGVFNYEFNDIRVSEVWTTLNSLTNRARQIDFYQYEAAQLIFANSLLKSSIGDKYLELKKKINEINYALIIDTLKQVEKGNSFDAFINASSGYSAYLAETIALYKSLMQDILKNSRYQLKESPKITDYS